jgi:hypothetical protein
MADYLADNEHVSADQVDSLSADDPRAQAALSNCA